MKKPAGLVLLSGFVFLCGLQLLGGRPVSTAGSLRPLLIAVYLVLGALSLYVAMALWRVHPRALRLYSVWATAYLAGGAVVQVVKGGAPWSHIAIWWVFVGAVLVAVGVHLRHALR